MTFRPLPRQKKRTFRPDDQAKNVADEPASTKHPASRPDVRSYRLSAMASAPVGNKRPRPLAVAVADDGFLMPTEFLCDALLCSSWSAGPGDRSHQTSPATRAFVAGPRARGGEIRFMDMSGEAATMSSGIRVAEDRTYSLDLSWEVGSSKFGWRGWY